VIGRSLEEENAETVTDMEISEKISGEFDPGSG
jgi:hypothetical protein